jgi:hypothetical protein
MRHRLFAVILLSSIFVAEPVNSRSAPDSRPCSNAGRAVVLAVEEFGQRARQTEPPARFGYVSRMITL